MYFILFSLDIIQKIVANIKSISADIKKAFSKSIK